jgi:hypothetical protein
MPLRHRATLERALEDAERIGQRFLLQQARKGGRAAKTDALQSLIERIVARRPSISAEQLLEALRDHERIRPIQDIVAGVIEFTDHNGASKSAPISGLKDRLSRAKKKIRSR